MGVSKVCMGCWGHYLVENIYILYFFKPWQVLGAIGKHDMKDIGGCWRGPNFFVFGVARGTKNDIENGGGAK
jgi:hypothetical protein